MYDLLSVVMSQLSVEGYFIEGTLESSMTIICFDESFNGTKRACSENVLSIKIGFKFKTAFSLKHFFWLERLIRFPNGCQSLCNISSIKKKRT